MAATDVERARRLVLRFGWNSTAYQILNPGIQYWFAGGDFAVVGFLPRVGVRVTAGAPVCPPGRLLEAVRAFEDDARSSGQQVCWFAAERRLEELLEDDGDRALLQLGAQPVWSPLEWRERVHTVASLRAQFNRSRNKGVSIEEWSTERARASTQLLACLRSWLRQRGLPPLHFLVESQTLDRLEDRRLFVAEQAGDVVGFVVASPVPARRGWLLEQVVRGPGAPNGTAELMIDAAVRTLADEGADYLTLGLAPLSGKGRRAGAEEPWWLRGLLAWARAHGRRFYNFQGLEFFKSKFRPPHWEPVFAICPGPHASVRVVYAVAAAFSDGPPLAMLARALGQAIRREFRGVLRGAYRRLLQRPRFTR